MGSYPNAAVAILLMCALLGSCAPEQAPAPSASLVPAVPLHVLARTIADFRGRTVRTCGSQLQPAWGASGEVANWRLSVRDPTGPYHFPAIVILPSCNGERPRMERGGCITGRIAREDGSLDDPDVEIIGSHQIMNYEWWLHPQCPSR